MVLQYCGCGNITTTSLVSLACSLWSLVGLNVLLFWGGQDSNSSSSLNVLLCWLREASMARGSRGRSRRIGNDRRQLARLAGSIWGGIIPYSRAFLALLTKKTYAFVKTRSAKNKKGETIQGNFMDTIVFL